MKKIIYILLFLSFGASAQKWSYNEGGNPFDGKYKTSSITGISSNTPYNSPIIVINKFDESDDFNFYISEVAYFQSYPDIFWSFNNNPDVIYEMKNAQMSDGKTIFFLSHKIKSEKSDISKYTSIFEVSNIEMIENFKTSSILNMRIIDDYESYDLIFSLEGSKEAIEFTLTPSYVENKLLELDSIRKLTLIEISMIDSISSIIGSHLSEYNIANSQIEEILGEIKGYNKSKIESAKIDFSQYHSLKIEHNYSDNFSLFLYDNKGNLLKKLSSFVIGRIPSIDLKLLKKINRNK